MTWVDNFRDISQLGSATLLSTAITMAEGVVVARILGPAVLGAWFTFQIVARYGGRLHLGVPNAFRRQLSVDKGAGNESEINELSDVVATFLIIVISVQIVIVAGLSAGSTFSSDFRLIALLGILIIAFQSARAFVNSYNNGVGDFEENAVLKLLKAASSIITIALTVQFSLIGFLIGRILREVVPFGIGFYRIGYIPSLSFDIERLQNLIKVGFLIMIVSFSSEVFKTVDRLMIIWYFPSESLGFYGTGDTFATLLLTVSGVVTNVLYTSFSEKYGADVSSEKFKGEILKTVKIVSYLFPAIFVNLYVFIPLIIQLVLPKYPMSVPVARALAFGYIFFAGASIIGSVLHSFKKQRLYIFVIAVSVLINTGLNYAVVQLGGELIGISIATAFAYLIYFLLVFGVVLAYFESSVGIFMKATLQIIAPALFAFGYAYGVSKFVYISVDSFSIHSVSIGLYLLAATLPISILFGFLTFRESEIAFSRVKNSITDLY